MGAFGLALDVIRGDDQANAPLTETRAQTATEYRGALFDGLAKASVRRSAKRLSRLAGLPTGLRADVAAIETWTAECDRASTPARGVFIGTLCEACFDRLPTTLGSLCECTERHCG